MRHALRFKIATLILTMSVAPAMAKDIDQTFEKTFDVEKGDRLFLQHGDGDVVVNPWDRAQIEVHVRYRAEIKVLGLGRDDADFVVDFEQSGGVIRVVGRETGRSGFTIGFRSSHQFEYLYTVNAPPWIELELNGDDGDVSISDWAADIDVTLDDGDVTLKRLTSARVAIEIEDGDVHAEQLVGELFVRSDDGDVYLADSQLTWGRFRLQDGSLSIDDCSGDIDAVTDDGQVRMRRLTAGEVEVTSQDGDIELDLIGSATMEVDVESDDGDVEIDLPERASLSFEIYTGAGRVDLRGGALDDVEEGRRRASGVLGGGEGRLRIRTKDGNVRVHAPSI